MTVIAGLSRNDETILPAQNNQQRTDIPQMVSCALSDNFAIENILLEVITLSEEKKVIPYKMAKGNRPKIEEVIAYCLDGELQENALNFTMWMRENKMPLKLYTSNTRCYRVDYKGWTLCYVFLHHMDDNGNDSFQGKPSYIKITPTLQLFNKYKDIVISENLTTIKWDDDVTAYTCDICHGGPNHESVDRTIFNKNFKSICKWRGLKAHNPDAAAFETIKKLLKLDQKARDALN